jgi:hypothetical protein
MSQYCDILRSHKPGDTLSVEVLRWADNEVLDGQLNGRELAVTAQGGDTNTSNDNSSSNTNDSTSTDVVNPNATASGDFYYYTDFDTNMDSWSYFMMNGSDDGFSTNLSNSKLRVDIEKQNTWVYFTYDDYTYTDVRIDTKAENLGRNNNNISLICRYSNDGWYEFNVYNNGNYDIFYYDNVVAKDYKLLYRGASTAIKTGKNTNEYTAVCQGNTLTLGINGVEVRSVKSNDLKDGKVGFGLSSFDVLPIIAEFDGFAASVP